MSKKALILTWESYQDHEVVYPFYRVQEEGFKVDIMANKIGRIFGILGTYNECTQSVYDLDDQKLFERVSTIFWIESVCILTMPLVLMVIYKIIARPNNVSSLN